ncbi:MAG: class I SAM-dependent methyltransferase [Terrimicrobiaceae bacterium]|nr:class I SAM-dependent methyltransferase [Terrimicrobiaceae bacterium]
MSLQIFTRRVAGCLSRSVLFARARAIWAENQRAYDLPLTRWQKLNVGLYLILDDYSGGRFPPKFSEQAETFERERRQFEARTNVELDRSADWNRRTPFWLTTDTIGYVWNYLVLLKEMIRCGLKEGDRVLELGCGAGWMSEFLSASHCQCVATSLSPFEVETAAYRVDVTKLRRSAGSLKFAVSAMEEIDRQLSSEPPFKFAFVHAALHHAHSWSDCLRAVYRILEPGGWFLICNEPGVLHTFISYRVARLDGTHEIGMNRDEIVRRLREIGFDEVRIFRNRSRWLLGPIWLAARKARE